MSARAILSSLVLGLVALAATCPGADPPPASDGLVLVPAFAARADGGVRIDTRASDATWNACVLTAPGRLAPGASYCARITCRIDELGEDSYLHLLVRPAGLDSPALDLGRADVVAVGREQRLTLRFSVPADRADYAVQVHTRKRLRALVRSIALEPGLGGRSLPLDGPAPAVAPPIPGGASDFAIDLPRPSSTPAVSVADCGADPASADNTPAFERAIARCRAERAAGIRVPPGTYRFAADRPLDFSRLADAEIDGGGSTWVFRKRAGALVRLAQCERVRLARLAIDWDWEADPLASTVAVAAVGEDHVDLRFVDHARFPRRDVRVADLEQLDPATGSVGCEDAVNASFEFYRGTSPAPRTEWLGDDLLRLHLEPSRRGFARQVAPGMRFRLRHYVYDMSGVEMASNRHLTLEEVTVLSCPGHAFVTSGEQHHWQFLRTHVRRPAGSARPITCTADHHHVARSQGFFRMEGCEFSLGGDDCLNVHDTTGFAVPAGPRTLRTRNLRGGGSLAAGDPIELRQDDFAPAGWTAPLEGVAAVDAGQGVYELRFARDLPAAAGDGFVLFNRRYGTRQVVVRDCWFHDNRARALLLLADDVTVENCRFSHQQMGAIKIESGFTLDSWSEGYGAANIVIRNNRFENVNPMGAYANELRPAIYLSSYLRSDPSIEKTRYPILRDILIEGNVFSDNPGVLVSVCSAGNVTIRGNRCEERTPRRHEMPYRGWIAVTHADAVAVTGNVWMRSPLVPAPAVLVDPETTGAVWSWGNRVE